MRVLLFALFIFPIAAFAQGGKAEPRQIKFAAGSTTATVAGALRNGQEMDYSFAATKGQTVTVSNSTKSQFDFRVFNEEYFSDGDFDSSATYTFVIPETGDYLFTVRKKATASRSARFSLRLTIR